MAMEYRSKMMTYKILTVDDSRTIRMIVKKAFSPYDCELFEAENGSEGLALATKVNPDLIVLDITMPVMTGVEMLKRMKEEQDLNTIPVIMLTAESGKDNVMNIVKMGVKDYIVKPFKGEQLIERVQNILDLKSTGEDTGPGKEEQETVSFSADGDIVILTLPRKIKRSVAGQIETTTKEKLAKLSSVGARKIIVDTSKIYDLNMTAIQMIINLVNRMEHAKMIVRLVAADRQISALKGFKETSSLPTLSSIENAKDAF